MPHKGTDSSEDEVSLMHAPMAVNWHVSKRALPRRQSLSQANATGPFFIQQTVMMTKNGCAMTCSRMMTPTLRMNRTQHTFPVHRALRPMALLRARVLYTINFFFLNGRHANCTVQQTSDAPKVHSFSAHR